jgi:hypothetical protein
MNEVKQLTKQTIALTEKIGKALAPIFEEHAEQGEAMQKAMILMTMRTIQASTYKKDWQESAKLHAQLLISGMQLGFIKKNNE